MTKIEVSIKNRSVILSRLEDIEKASSITIDEVNKKMAELLIDKAKKRPVKTRKAGERGARQIR